MPDHPAPAAELASTPSHAGRPSAQLRLTPAAIRAWIYVGLWLGIISFESTELLSSAHTASLLATVLTAIFGPIAPAKLIMINAVGRKIGHFVGYAILSYLLFHAWRETLHFTVKKLWRVRWSVLAVLGTVAVAALDEWHQTRLVSRTGNWRDVVLDSFGGIFAQTTLMLALVGRARARD